MMLPIFRVLFMCWLSAAAADECQECDAPVSKTGVAMLVRGVDTKYATIFSSRTDGIEHESQLMKKMLSNPGVELTDSDMAELASMRITPQVQTFLSETLSKLGDVIQTLYDLSDAARVSRNTSWAKINASETALMAKSFTWETGLNYISTQRVIHTTCREAEWELHLKKVQCDKEQSDLNNTVTGILKDELTPANDNFADPLCGNAVAENVDVKIPMIPPYILAAKKYLNASARLEKKIIECNNITHFYTEKQAACETDQNIFEKSVCDIGATKATDWCSSYKGSYDAHLLDYEDLMKDITAGVVKRKFELVHLSKCGCSFKALMGLTDEKSQKTVIEKLQACGKQDYEDEKNKLTVRYIQPPAQIPCPYVIDLPCTLEFKRVEYSPLDVKITECTMSCELKPE